MIKKIIYLLAGLSCLASCAQTTDNQNIATPVDFTCVSITDSFWKHRIDINAQVTIPHSIQKCYDEGRVDNFLAAAGIKEGRFNGHWGFNDSDVYKVLEGMAFSYSVNKDPAMLAQMDTLVSYIAASQQSDGYLYTPWTLRAKDYAEIYCTYDKEPYDNLIQSHEFYNMGHMYEAAVAHYIATGQKNFLNIALKSADHIYGLFGPGKREAVPGHEEIEIGLLKLYGVTGNVRYMDLAKLFMDRRGHGLLGGETYYQDHLPIVEQTEAFGHSVRANYLYTAMAQYAALTGDAAYTAAVDSLWANVVGKKMYITGGMGAYYDGERYGDNYDLPNLSYAETCASIAGVFWARNMFSLHAEGQYFDVLERILYNGLISGISLDGTRFFYPNVMSNENAGAFNRGNYGRAEWFDCSCCPTNDVRFISSLPGYVYAVKGNEVFANLYVSNEASFPVEGTQVKLSEKTEYPWKGDVSITVGTSAYFALSLRIPLWAQGHPLPGDLYSYVGGEDSSWSIEVNGIAVNCAPLHGYCRIAREWKEGDVVTLKMEMNPRIVAANELVEADRGKLAVECGPLVYCAESVDNPGMNVFKSGVAPETTFTEGVTSIEGTLVKTLTSSDSGLTLIPYYAWSHRGPSDMTIWLSE